MPEFCDAAEVQSPGVMTERPLYEDAYFRVVADHVARVVRLVRSSAAFPTPEAAETCLEAVAFSLITIRRGWVLLVDSRGVPIRNDAAFEQVLARARHRIVGRFACAAILVASDIGKLQVARYGREDPKSPPVFRDEEEALAYLTANRTSK
jgi:hypothetical protein